MVQGGDPTGTGKGGKSVFGGKFADEISDRLTFDSRGVLAMANSGPNTNASQFFFAYAKLPHLDGKYTVFGRVIHGAEVLDAMERAPVGKGDRPLEDIVLKGATVHANPLAA